MLQLEEIPKDSSMRNLTTVYHIAEEPYDHLPSIEKELQKGHLVPTKQIGNSYGNQKSQTSFEHFLMLRYASHRPHDHLLRRSQHLKPNRYRDSVMNLCQVVLAQYGLNPLKSIFYRHLLHHKAPRFTSQSKTQRSKGRRKKEREPTSFTTAPPVASTSSLGDEGFGLSLSQ